MNIYICNNHSINSVATCIEYKNNVIELPFQFEINNELILVNHIANIYVETYIITSNVYYDFYILISEIKYIKYTIQFRFNDGLNFYIDTC